MFVGHYAVALAAKRLAPGTSLGLSFAAVQLLDILWAPAILLGLEQARIVPGYLPASSFQFLSYPWTHGLLMAFAWAWFTTRFSKSLVLGGCVFSHWLLDYVAHSPDLPIYRGGALVGLGLWRYREATFAVETLMLLAGLWVYMKATQNKRPAGTYAIPVLVAALVLLDAVNLYGPAPRSMTEAVIVAEILLLGLSAVAWWLDRLREPVRREEPPISILGS